MAGGGRLTAAELLVSGADRPPRRPGPVLLSALTALLLLAGLDAAAAARAEGALLRDLDRAVRTAAYAEARLAATVAYAAPQLDSPRAPERVRVSLRRLVERTAADGVPAVRRAQQQVAAVPVAPWRADLRRARDAASEWLVQRLRRLQAVAAGYAAYGRSDPALDTRRAAAARAVAALVGPGRARAVLGVSP